MPVLSRFFISKFSVIDRYILRELFMNMLAVTGMLMLIYVATTFTRFISAAAVGDLPADVVMNLVGYSAIGALSMLLPISSFLAAMLALGRMNSDNELTVIMACGIPVSRIRRNVFLFSLVTAILVAWLALVIVPSVLSGRYDVEQKAQMAANTTGLVAGSFKESRNGDWTFYSQRVSDNGEDMENVFIEIKRGHNQKPLIFRADKGHFEIDNDTGDKFLVLENGYRYEGRAGDQDFKIAKFATHSLLIEKGNQNQVKEKFKLSPTLKLWHRGLSQDIAEIEWRISSAIMPIILCLIAMPLAQSGPRQGRFAGFFPAVVVYIIYSNLLAVTQAWVAKGSMPIWVGAIWVHVLVLMLLVMLTQRQRIRRWLRPKRQWQA